MQEDGLSFQPTSNTSWYCYKTSKTNHSVYFFSGNNPNNFENIYAFSKFSKINAFNLSFHSNDAFIFGSETRGLPEVVLNLIPNQNRLRIPMLKKNRSLNLSNAVSIIVYEAWRQNKFLNAQIAFKEN